MKIRRIVVGLDTAPHSRSALAAAAALASQLDAELEALLVESEELHGLARLPFAREMGYSSAAVRPIDAVSLERALAAREREARRALTAMADPHALRWSLRVTRGSATREIVAASTDADITVIGISQWSPETLQLAPEAPTTLLVLPQSGRYRGPLAAICPVAVTPERAVNLVTSLSTAVGDGVTILVVGDDLAAAGFWCERAGELLRAQNRRAEFEIVRVGQPEALEAALTRLAPRAVAILAPSPVAAT